MPYGFSKTPKAPMIVPVKECPVDDQGLKHLPSCAVQDKKFFFPQRKKKEKEKEHVVVYMHYVVKAGVK